MGLVSVRFNACTNASASNTWNIPQVYKIAAENTADLKSLELNKISNLILGW